MTSAHYWLFKTEPHLCSIDDLAAAREPLVWDGIRNYQARNFLRDQVACGDQVLIYHSSCREVGIAGIAAVVRSAYPDPQQYLPDQPGFDPRASPDSPRWFNVDVRFVAKFTPLLPMAALRQLPELEQMVLLRQGRLSVQPVTTAEWAAIVQRAGASV